jgi:hypothetical protein
LTSTFSSVALSARYPRVVVKRACEPLDCPAASVAAVVEVVELVVVVVVVAAAAVAAVDTGRVVVAAAAVAAAAAVDGTAVAVDDHPIPVLGGCVSV